MPGFHEITTAGREHKNTIYDPTLFAGDTSLEHQFPNIKITYQTSHFSRETTTSGAQHCRNHIRLLAFLTTTVIGVRY